MPASGAELLESAFHLHRSGRLNEALSLCRSAIATNPRSDVAHNLLGALHCAQGRLSEGEACFRTALDINASNVEALNNLASARKEQGDLAAAETLYRRALELQPDASTAWNNLGLVYLGGGSNADAERCFRHVLSIDPGNAEAHNNLGTILRADRPAEAESEFRAAVAADPALAEGWCGLGDVLTLRGLLDEAETCCRKALELKPGYLDATNNLATIAKLRGRLDLAKLHCDDVLRVAPRHLGALNNAGSIAAMQCDYASAERVYRDALRIDPGHSVTRFNLSTLLLLLGNYEEGFDFYESRYEAFGGAPTRSPRLNEMLASRPRWRGEPLGGHVLVWAEQGLGDSIMMLRYLQEVRARGIERVSVVCDASLVRLVRAMSLAELVLTPDQVDASLEFDAHCPIMSLPAVFGTRLETIPDRVPYVTVPSHMVAAWRERLADTRPRVGIAWAGNKKLRDDARRSIPLAQFQPLLAQDAIQFVSLQKGDAAAQWREFGRDDNWIAACDDFLDTAALISALDLVISVDTAVAHLAGALGRPVWLLNRFGSEWRWGQARERSPWYPSMRIYNQQRSGGWSELVDRIDSELGILASAKDVR